MTQREPIKFFRRECRVIPIFGDVSGWRPWIRRVGRDQIRREWPKIQAQFDRFAVDASTYKTLGDGFMSIYELGHGRNGQFASQLLQKMIDATEEINRVISEMPHPRPGFFRIRATDGDELKWRQKNGNRVQMDFVGQWTNLARDLLHVSEEIPVIVTQGFKDRVAKHHRQAEPFTFTRLSKPFVTRNLTIFQEDLAGLYQVQRREEAKCGNA